VPVTAVTCDGSHSPGASCHARCRGRRPGALDLQAPLAPSHVSLGALLSATPRPVCLQGGVMPGRLWEVARVHNTERQVTEALKAALRDGSYVEPKLYPPTLLPTRWVYPQYTALPRLPELATINANPQLTVAAPGPMVQCNTLPGGQVKCSFCIDRDCAAVSGGRTSTPQQVAQEAAARRKAKQQVRQAAAAPRGNGWGAAASTAVRALQLSLMMPQECDPGASPLLMHCCLSCCAAKAPHHQLLVVWVTDPGPWSRVAGEGGSSNECTSAGAALQEMWDVAALLLLTGMLLLPVWSAIYLICLQHHRRRMWQAENARRLKLAVGPLPMGSSNEPPPPPLPHPPRQPAAAAAAAAASIKAKAKGAASARPAPPAPPPSMPSFEAAPEPETVGAVLAGTLRAAAAAAAAAASGSVRQLALWSVAGAKHVHSAWAERPAAAAAPARSRQKPSAAAPTKQPPRGKQHTQAAAAAGKGAASKLQSTAVKPAAQVAQPPSKPGTKKGKAAAVQPQPRAQTPTAAQATPSARASAPTAPLPQPAVARVSSSRSSSFSAGSQSADEAPVGASKGAGKAGYARSDSSTLLDVAARSPELPTAPKALAAAEPAPEARQQQRRRQPELAVLLARPKQQRPDDGPAEGTGHGTLASAATTSAPSTPTSPEEPPAPTPAAASNLAALLASRLTSKASPPQQAPQRQHAGSPAPAALGRRPRQSSSDAAGLTAEPVTPMLGGETLPSAPSASDDDVGLPTRDRDQAAVAAAAAAAAAPLPAPRAAPRAGASYLPAARCAAPAGAELTPAAGAAAPDAAGEGTGGSAGGPSPAKAPAMPAVMEKPGLLADLWSSADAVLSDRGLSGQLDDAVAAMVAAGGQQGQAPAPLEGGADDSLALLAGLQPGLLGAGSGGGLGAGLAPLQGLEARGGQAGLGLLQQALAAAALQQQLGQQAAAAAPQGALSLMLAQAQLQQAQGAGASAGGTSSVAFAGLGPATASLDAPPGLSPLEPSSAGVLALLEQMDTDQLAALLQQRLQQQALEQQLLLHQASAQQPLLQQLLAAQGLGGAPGGGGGGFGGGSGLAGGGAPSAALLAALLGDTSASAQQLLPAPSDEPSLFGLHGAASALSDMSWGLQAPTSSALLPPTSSALLSQPSQPAAEEAAAGKLWASDSVASAATADHPAPQQLLTPAMIAQRAELRQRAASPFARDQAAAVAGLGGGGSGSLAGSPGGGGGGGATEREQMAAELDELLDMVGSCPVPASQPPLSSFRPTPPRLLCQHPAPAPLHCPPTSLLLPLSPSLLCRPACSWAGHPSPAAARSAPPSPRSQTCAARAACRGSSPHPTSCCLPMMRWSASTQAVAACACADQSLGAAAGRWHTPGTGRPL